MPRLYNYRIFISHAWKYGDDYNRLINLLNTAPNFSYYDYSAPQTKPLFPEGTPYTSRDIASKITDKISPSQVVLVLSGMYLNYHDWMKYEVQEALRMNKPIIAVVPWGQERVPQEIAEVATKLVSWNSNSIIAAIRALA